MAMQRKACRICYPRGSNVNSADKREKTLLMGASQRGHLMCAKALIEAGADVNAIDVEGDTALIRCCQANKGECVKLLIKSGGDVNTVNRHGVNALSSACMDGHMKCVKPLIGAGVDLRTVISQRKNGLETCALYCAAERNHFDVVKLLLEARADVNERSNGETALMAAAWNRSFESAKLLLEAGADVNLQSLDVTRKCNSKYISGDTVLYGAVGSCRMMQLLTEAGASVNASGRKKPLHRAVRKCKPSCVEFLIKNGADVNSRCGEGLTSLHYAANGKYIANIEQLLKAGADINATDKGGRTPLYRANAFSRYANVQELLKAGADVNLVDKGGETVLMIAAARTNVDNVDSMIRAGADVNIRNARGETALIRTGSEQPGAGHAMINCVRLLLSAGSHINIFSASKDNLLKRCIKDYGCDGDEDSPQMAVRNLLYAAGEEGDFEPYPDEITLRHCCRKVIRKRLITCNPRVHLFETVPSLGLPCIVNEYLLYDQTLDLEFTEEDESETSDEDYDFSDERFRDKSDDEEKEHGNNYARFLLGEVDLDETDENEPVDYDSDDDSCSGEDSDVDEEAVSDQTDDDDNNNSGEQESSGDEGADDDQGDDDDEIIDNCADDINKDNVGQ